MNISEIFSFLKTNYDVTNAVSAIASALAAFLAFGVAVISIFFTSRALKQQHEYNRMSVRPLPYITVGSYEDLIYVKIRNNGTGPLIVASLTVLGASEPSNALVLNMPALEPGIFWKHFGGKTEGRSIPVVGEMVLIELSGSSETESFRRSRDNVREALGWLALTLDYTDIYGSKLPKYSRDLKWFQIGRAHV